jgi:hypothetical protein
MYGNYMQDGNVGNSKSPSSVDTKPDQATSHSTMKNAPAHVDNKIQTIMRDLMVAKAAAVAGNSSSIAPPESIEEKGTTADLTSEQRRKIKKRPAPSTSPSVQSKDSGSFQETLLKTDRWPWSRIQEVTRRCLRRARLLRPTTLSRYPLPPATVPIVLQATKRLPRKTKRQRRFLLLLVVVRDSNA